MNPPEKDPFANRLENKKVMAPPKTGTGDVDSVLSQYGTSVGAAGGEASAELVRLRSLLLKKRNEDQMRAMGIATSIRAGGASGKPIPAESNSNTSKFNHVKDESGLPKSATGMGMTIPRRTHAPLTTTAPDSSSSAGGFGGKPAFGGRSSFGGNTMGGTGSGDPFADALWGSSSETSGTAASVARGSTGAAFGAKATIKGSSSTGGVSGWVSKTASTQSVAPTGLNPTATSFVPTGRISAGGSTVLNNNSSGTKSAPFSSVSSDASTAAPKSFNRNASALTATTTGGLHFGSSGFGNSGSNSSSVNATGGFSGFSSSGTSSFGGGSSNKNSTGGFGSFGSKTTRGGFGSDAGSFSTSSSSSSLSSGTTSKSIFGSPAPAPAPVGVNSSDPPKSISSPITPFNFTSQTPTFGSAATPSFGSAATSGFGSVNKPSFGAGVSPSPAIAASAKEPPKSNAGFSIPLVTTAAPITTTSSSSFYSNTTSGNASNSSLASVVSAATSSSGSGSKPSGDSKAVIMDDSLYITDDDDDDEESIGKEDDHSDGDNQSRSGSEMDDYLSDEEEDHGDDDGMNSDSGDSGSGSSAGSCKSSVSVSTNTGSTAGRTRHQPVLVSSITAGRSTGDLYSAGIDGVDGVKYGGTCMDMDPEELAQRRTYENDVHKVEMKLGVMIKKLQRSSADHELQITHYIRPPFVLLNTVQYIEDNVMELGEVVEEEAGAASAQGGLANFLGGGGASANIITPIEAYLYIWDRYRMIAKDFILQMASDELPSSSTGAGTGTVAGTNIDPYASMFLMMPPHPQVVVGTGDFLVQRMLHDICCVHVHERMTRWFVMMDHYLCTFEEFVSQHKQQNGEQLFRLIKSLNEFYEKSRNIKNKYHFDPLHTDKDSPEVCNYDMLLNESEFASYFILYQLDNGKEVPVFIRGLQTDVLQSRDVQFAIKVWIARKTQDYACFFKLLRHEATYLQACIMYKYVTSTRLQAMRKISRSYRAGKAETYVSISRLTCMLAFESEDDATDFFTYCGYEIEDGFDGEDPVSGAAMSSMCVILTAGQVIDQMLPVDKNGHAIPPVAKMMENCIESKVLASKFKNATAVRNFESDKLYISKADICRGMACTGKRVVHTLLPRWIAELTKNKQPSFESKGNAPKAALRAPATKKVADAAVSKPLSAGFMAPPVTATAAKVSLPKSSKLAMAAALGGGDSSTGRAKSTPTIPVPKTAPFPPPVPARGISPAPTAGFPAPKQDSTSDNLFQGAATLNGQSSSTLSPASSEIAAYASGGFTSHGIGVGGKDSDSMVSLMKPAEVKRKPLPPLSVDRDTPPATASPPISAHGTSKPPLESKMRKTVALTNLSSIDGSSATSTDATAAIAASSCTVGSSSTLEAASSIPPAVPSRGGIGFSSSAGIACDVDFDSTRKPIASIAPSLSIELPGSKALPPAGPSSGNGSSMGLSSQAWSFGGPPSIATAPGVNALSGESLTHHPAAAPMSLQSSNVNTSSISMSVDATPVSTPLNAAFPTPKHTTLPSSVSFDSSPSAPSQNQAKVQSWSNSFADSVVDTCSSDSSVSMHMQLQRMDPLEPLTRVFEATVPSALSVLKINRRGDELQRKMDILCLCKILVLWRKCLWKENQRSDRLLQTFCFRKLLRVFKMRRETRKRFLTSFQDSSRLGSQGMTSAAAGAIDVLLNRRIRKKENGRTRGKLAVSSQWVLERDKTYFHLHGPNALYKTVPTSIFVESGKSAVASGGAGAGAGAGSKTINGTTNSLLSMLQHLGSDFSPAHFSDIFPSLCDILAPQLYYLQSLYVYCLSGSGSTGSVANNLFASEDPRQLFACSQRAGKDSASIESSAKWHGSLLYKLALCSSANRSGQWEFRHEKPIYGYGQSSVKVPNNFTGHYLTPNILRSLLTTENCNSAINPLMIGIHEQSAVCYTPDVATMFGDAEAQTQAQVRRRTRVSVVDLCATYNDAVGTSSADQDSSVSVRLASSSPLVQGCNGAVLLISEYDMLCMSDEEFAACMSSQLVCLMKNTIQSHEPSYQSQAVSLPPVVLIFSRDRLMKSASDQKCAEKSTVEWHVLSMEHHRQQIESGTVQGSCDDDVHMVQSVLLRVQALVGMHMDVNFQLKGVYIINARLNAEQGFPYFDLAQLAQYQLCLSGAINLLVQAQSLKNARACSSEEELMALDNSSNDNGGTTGDTVGMLLERNASSLLPLVEKVDMCECIAERINEAVWSDETRGKSGSGVNSLNVDMDAEHDDHCYSEKMFGNDAAGVLDGIEQVLDRLLHWLQFSVGAVSMRSNAHLSGSTFVFPPAMITAFPPVDFCNKSAAGDMACDAVLYASRVVDGAWGDTKLPYQWNSPTAANNSNVEAVRASVGMIQSLSVSAALGRGHGQGVLESKMSMFTAHLDQLAAQYSASATNINLWRDKLNKSARGLLGLLRAAESVQDTRSRQYKELCKLWGQRVPAWRRAVSMLYQFVIKAKFRGFPTLYTIAEIAVPPVETIAFPAQSGMGFLLQHLTSGNEASAVLSKRRKREDEPNETAGIVGTYSGGGNGRQWIAASNHTDEGYKLPLQADATQSQQTKKRITVEDVAETMHKVSEWDAAAVNTTEVNVSSLSDHELEVVSLNIKMPNVLHAVSVAAKTAQQQAAANQLSQVLTDFHSDMDEEFQRAAAFNAYMAKQLMM